MISLDSHSARVTFIVAAVFSGLLVSVKSFILAPVFYESGYLAELLVTLQGVADSKNNYVGVH